MGGTRVVGYIPLGWLGVWSMAREHMYIYIYTTVRWAIPRTVVACRGGFCQGQRFDGTESHVPYTLEEKHNKHSKISYILI